MASISSSYNPEMLVWARNGVGYTLEQAAEAIGVSTERLKAAESGEGPLSVNQVRKAAEKYSCPFGYFYFSKPPYSNTDKPIPDYRIEPTMVGVENYRLQLEIKKVRDRRLVYLELLDEIGEEKSKFGTIKNTKRTEDIGTKIRSRLKVSKSELETTPLDKIYSYWKNKIELDGVLVYESQYIPVDCGVIGSAIFYEAYPIILIKRGGEFNPRRLFTLLHEYAHLLQGQSAINDARSQVTVRTDSEHSALEVECNRIAGEILVPSELLSESKYANLTPTEKMVALANDFKVTYTTAAVCLRRRRLIDKSDYNRLISERLSEHRKKRRKNERSEIKIPRETIQRIDLGRPFFNAVLSAYETGRIDVYDASKILNLRVKKIDVLAGRQLV